MLCEKCGVNAATTHIRTLLNGKVYEKHLCADCAASEAYCDVKVDNITQMLSSMFGDNKPIAGKNNVIRCDCCGSTFSDIANSGKCGCAMCYSIFYEQLLPYFKKAQYGKNAHVGKVPDTVAKHKKTNKERLTELKLLLNELVTSEKYEDAAVIRDEIKLLEGEMQ